MRSTMPRARNHPCNEVQSEYETAKSNRPQADVYLERGRARRVSRARKSTRMARLSVLLICRTFEALLTSVMTV